MSTYQSEQFPIPTPGRLRRELRLRRPPWWMITLLVVVVIGTWVPLALIYQARGTKSKLPRIHLIQDMGKQPRRNPQTGHDWFLDGRAMRLPVEGTIARGRLQHNEHYFHGFFRQVDTASGRESIEFATSLPPEIDVTPELLARGQTQFAVFCGICHGDDGLGNGPINQRAIQLNEPKWVPATNLMTQEIRDRDDGQLFQAIRDGVRNMPAYGTQINPQDRWAIVAWLRELQANSPVAPQELVQ